MHKMGDKTIYCVAQVRYHLDPKSETPDAKLCYLTLVGEDNPSDSPQGWPSWFFLPIWSGTKATR